MVKIGLYNIMDDHKADVYRRIISEVRKAVIGEIFDLKVYKIAFKIHGSDIYEYASLSMGITSDGEGNIGGVTFYKTVDSFLDVYLELDPYLLLDVKI